MLLLKGGDLWVISSYPWIIINYLWLPESLYPIRIYAALFENQSSSENFPLLTISLSLADQHYRPFRPWLLGILLRHTRGKSLMICHENLSSASHPDTLLCDRALSNGVQWCARFWKLNSPTGALSSREDFLSWVVSAAEKGAGLAASSQQFLGCRMEDCD